MSLELHSIVTQQKALASLTDGAASQVLRDGEFVVTPAIVVAFLRPALLTFRSPTLIEWEPGDNRDQIPWLLALTKPPFPKYHLLIEGASGFFYAGTADLGSFAWDGSSAKFYMSVPLPRDAWMRFGGYPHWLVTLNHQEQRLGSEDDDVLRSLLRRVIALPHGHLTLTRYEEDSLELFTNDTRGWLMYLREPGDAGLYIAAAQDEGDEPEHFRCDCGIDLEFPRSQTLPVERAADVVAEFFRSGTLPASVNWKPQ